MKRLVPPDGAVVETSVRGERTGAERLYHRQKDGTMHVESDSDYKALKKMGFFEPNAGGFARAQGWICEDCGFHGYFKKCGKCGSESMRRPK